MLPGAFLRKSQLPGEYLNEFLALPDGHPVPPDDFLAVREKKVRQQLKRLKVEKATGPNEVSARVLKKCADSPARPLTFIIRLVLQTSRWPSCERFRHTAPLYKKNARSDPNSYRRVHLTGQISKVAERVIGKLSPPKLQQSGVFGNRQFAYAIGRGHRDALALSVLPWLLSMEKGNLVGLYCSDASGAFDRVCEQRLAEKLNRTGLHPRVVGLLRSWLGPCVSVVVLDGQRSAPKPLRNSVYQGTVLGPPLWNVHYADSSDTVQSEGFSEVIFADDLNCSKEFGNHATERQIRAELRGGQKALHRWGAASCVLFGPGTESFHCLHRTRSFGDDFKILGVLFDCQLTMQAAAQEVARESGWKVRSLLWCRRFYTTPELVKL